MPCLETTIGTETYFVILSIVVGAIVNLVKRVRFVPGDAVPVIAFVIGWVLDATLSHVSCGMIYTDAALSGLGGGIAGLAAAGGHEALSRVAGKFGLGTVADILLGKAKREKAKRGSEETKVGSALIVLLSLSLSGCSSLLAALTKAQQGAQYLDTVISVAEAGADTYFARHPSLDNERKVDVAVRRAKSALAALNAALAVAEATNDEDVERARAEALVTYAELRKLLGDLGVLSASSPAGGAETDAPEPEPVALPEPEHVAELL